MTQYRSHVSFNQQLLSDVSAIRDRKELALKSVDKSDFVEASSSSFKRSDSSELQSYNQGEAIETDLMSIDSCTKTITADAFRKMVKDHPEIFPEGQETKANEFIGLLKSRFPSSDYIQGSISPNLEEELTNQITLRDLLNHTSGLGNQTHKDFDERIKANPNHRLKEGELLEIDRKKGEYGKSEYSNQGYELLGMIMCAVEQNVQERDVASNPVQFSEVLEKYSFEPRGVKGRIFASDQIQIVGNKVEVKDHPELKVTSGRYYHEGKLHQSRPFNYDQFGAGGCYASTSAMISYMESFGQEDFMAIVESEKNKATQVEHQGKSYLVLQNCAGFTQIVLEQESGRVDINFGGKGYGNNSGALATFYSDGKKDLAFTAINSEDLTLPIALALIKKEKLEADKYPAIDDEINKKITELKTTFNEEQLIEIRKGLDQSYEKFTEIYKQQEELVSAKKMDSSSNAKTFFLVGPNVHHIEELQRAKEKLTQSGQLQVFELNSAEEYQAAIKKIQSYSQENPTDKIRIVTDAHGVERKGEDGKSHGTGQLGFGDKEVYPAEIAYDLEACNIEFIDNSACCIGTGIASKGNENLERYQNIPPNVPIILNGGKLRAITSLLQPEIVKTLSLGEDSSALDNFLNKVFHPNTLKVVMKKEDEELVTHKMSAPKPTSREDVTSEAVAQHIGQEINRAVDWWRDNVDSSINSEDLKKSCAERITPELVEQYRGQALIMETHRKKADYVRCYIEAGTDPNQTTADGSTPLHMSCSKIEVMKELLKSEKVDVNLLDSDGISVLCVASYAKNSKEVADLIMNHPQFDQTLESFNASREALKSIYLKGQPEYHDMNNSLVNYVRAELCFREGRAEKAKKYIGVAIEGEVADPSIKQEYQDRFQSYNKSMEALDLAMPKEVAGNKSEKSWVEKMEDKKLSALKGGAREI